MPSPTYAPTAGKWRVASAYGSKLPVILDAPDLPAEGGTPSVTADPPVRESPASGLTVVVDPLHDSPARAGNGPTDVTDPPVRGTLVGSRHDPVVTADPPMRGSPARADPEGMTPSCDKLNGALLRPTGGR